MGWLTSLVTGALIMVFALLATFFVSDAPHINRKPKVWLRYHMIDMMTFNCSAEGVSNIDDTRMLQIAYLDGDYPRTILAVIDNSGIYSSEDVFHKTLGMGDRSYDITGSFSSDMYWLHLAIFDSKLDIKLRNYGIFQCLLWRHGQDKDGPVRVFSVNILPEQKLPKGKPGFVVQYSTALDLICFADIPTNPGMPEFALNITNITQGSGQAALASWSHEKTLHCSTTPKCLCSPLKNKNEVYYGVTRLVEYLELNQSFECSVKNNEGKFAHANVCVSCSHGNVSHVPSVPDYTAFVILDRPGFIMAFIVYILLIIVVITLCVKYCQIRRDFKNLKKNDHTDSVSENQQNENFLS